MLKLFSDPDEAIGTGPKVPTKELSVSDYEDFLKEDEKPETIPLKDEKEIPAKPEEKPEDEESEETPEEEEKDELDELEEELAPPTEEQLEELITPVRRKEILKKYPTFFKDFPYMEKAYYRDQQFTQLLGTVEDAKEAVQARDALRNFEGQLMRGTTEDILKAVKTENPQAFYKIADDYLTTLGRVDEKAYYHVLGNVAKHTIVSMVTEARRLGVGEGQRGQALQDAAHILNQFIFGSSEFSPPTSLVPKENPQISEKEKEIQQREQQFTRTQFENSRNTLNTRINNVIRSTITENIDPNKSMTDYVRKSAEKEAFEMLESLFEKDQRFATLKDKLWEKVFESNFSPEALDKVYSAYKAKSRTLLPEVLKRARNNAYRGMGRRVREDKEEQTTDKGGPIKGGTPRTQNKSVGKTTDPKAIPRGMTSLEFLNSD